MKTEYQISLHIKTPSGFETYGNFSLGSDRDQAMAIVEQFKGSDDKLENSILYIDFTEVKDAIPLPIKLLHCTLDDIAYNVRVITRDVFKNLSLWKIDSWNWNFYSTNLKFLHFCCVGSLFVYTLQNKLINKIKK